MTDVSQPAANTDRELWRRECASPGMSYYEPSIHVTFEWRRLRACVERWPECEDSGYDPRCCRFPKSCSCMVYDEGAMNDMGNSDGVNEAFLEPIRAADEVHLEPMTTSAASDAVAADSELDFVKHDWDVRALAAEARCVSLQQERDEAVARLDVQQQERAHIGRIRASLQAQRNRADTASAALGQAQEALERRERLIREYQRRARAAVRVLTEHNLVEAYLLAFAALAVVPADSGAGRERNVMETQYDLEIRRDGGERGRPPSGQQGAISAAGRDTTPPEAAPALAPLDVTAILWVAALDRVSIEERVEWVQAMEARVREINATRAVVPAEGTEGESSSLGGSEAACSGGESE